MKTIAVNLYSFSELSKEIQEKVLEHFRYFNVEFDWYDFIFEEANSIGLKITNFNLDPSKIEGDLLSPPFIICKKIIKEHGKETPTYAFAKEYIDRKTKISIDDFRKRLMNEYLLLLRAHYDYLMIDSTVKEMIVSNDYEFFKNGDLFNENFI